VCVRERERERPCAHFSCISLRVQQVFVSSRFLAMRAPSVLCTHAVSYTACLADRTPFLRTNVSVAIRKSGHPAHFSDCRSNRHHRHHYYRHPSLCVGFHYGGRNQARVHRSFSLSLLLYLPFCFSSSLPLPLPPLLLLLSPLPSSRHAYTRTRSLSIVIDR